MPVVELSVDRSLVCANFDGYKLSFDSVPVLKQSLEIDPLRLEPHANQFSLLHVELFARHNHLFADPWLRHCNYYVNVRHQLVQCSYDPQSGRARGQRVVYSLDCRDQGDGYQHSVGDYNYTICFISERFCVICDGVSTYHLVDTGDRSRSEPVTWQRIAQTPVDVANDYRGFVLYDARLDVVQERKQISLISGHVARRDLAAVQEQTHVYYMDLVWGRWTQSPTDGEWEYSICQRLETTGSVHYCAFEPRAESLIIASNREVQTPEQRKAADEAAAVAAASAAPSGQMQNGHDHKFSWNQTGDDLLIRFPLPQGSNRNELNIRCTNTSVLVKHLEEELLSGELYARVDNDLTTWTVEADSLQLTLVKAEPQNWPQLLKQKDLAPEEAGTEEDSDAVADPPLPIPNLEDPIEDCDLGLTDEDIKMVRFNLISGGITHTIFLGSTPLLFSTTLRPGFPAAFATRQGVDASVWLQMYQPSRPDEWSVRHEGQLHAFGYVQASKEQRKFTACCPDLDFVVICESFRHVLVYRPRHDSAGGLRKRNGPPVTVGKQNLVTLEYDVGEILGMSTANNLITILTCHNLLHLQV
ncbi:nudC domain-containing protein 1 [Drosophila ficusphila]|uniref:nudC domain-containing protein 1 n=1 Tax=Drosophila ficusphila TaxID=30025 RepID=UPI0007E786D7|nr:nudC domain-containing protein 1 [Drosophila ficusphila]